ncbi:MAG: M12 family metallopeptidase [Bacteroidales bacterium]|nr:M12 family metallopeptidase [Bacteroidales bacterium]MCM1146854.1 M12 family metallopeptidase [Bacteroidales bacterium]MCM1205648.1 M12 family metallopeptidase [Bacillota bacterium]MCM1510240.1 M12 family metallopeptidase [Clostridium sp.]
MKYTFLLLFAAILLVACSDDLSAPDVSESNELCYLGYVPKGVPEEIHLSNGLTVYMDVDSTFFWGDVIFSKDQIRAFSTSTRRRSAAVKARVKYWPDKTIYYNISSDFDSYDQSTIRTALSNLSTHTGINFIESSSCPQRHLEFHVSNGNSSYIGMQDDGNVINLARYQPVGVAMHETMHSLGYFHEQSRTDRDQYITVYFENIENDKKSNFHTYQEDGYEGFNIGDFDYNSIMMYGSGHFSANGQYTMKRNDTMNSYGGGYIYANRTALSEGDIAGLYFIYGPTKAVNKREVIDEYSTLDCQDITYSNTVSFLDSNGEPVVLKYPRLIVAEYEYYHQRAGDSYEYKTAYTCYFTAPAGVSSYSLPTTNYYYEEEGYGIFRQSFHDYYSIFNY